VLSPVSEAGYGVLVDVVLRVPGTGVGIAFRPVLAAPALDVRQLPAAAPAPHLPAQARYRSGQGFLLLIGHGIQCLPELGLVT
jgi:hypothetical protein